MNNIQDLLDPIKFYNINENDYDKNFMDLFKHIISLINTNCIKIKEIKQEIPRPPIIYESTPIITQKPTPIIKSIIKPDYTEQINKLKLKYKELIIYINDLKKIYVQLYNKIKLIEETVKNNVKEISYILDKSKEDSTGKIPLNYKPIAFNDIDGSVIDNLDMDKTLEFGDKLILVAEELKRKIAYWLKYSEQLFKFFDIHKLTSDIFAEIIPGKSTTIYRSQVGGIPPGYTSTDEEKPESVNPAFEFFRKKEAQIAAQPPENKRVASNYRRTEQKVLQKKEEEPKIVNIPEIIPENISNLLKVQDVYNNLIKIKKLINGITKLNVDIEIPYGTELKFDGIIKNLTILQTNLENMILDYQTKNQNQELKQTYKLNVFEQMPQYYGLTSDFLKDLTTKQVESILPKSDIELNQIQIIHDSITNKIKEYDKKIDNIKNLYVEITDFLKIIDQYKQNEIIKYTNSDIIYPFTDIGLKIIIEQDIINLNTKLQIKTKELEEQRNIIKTITDNKVYLQKRNNIEKEDIQPLKEKILNLIKILTSYQPKGQTETILQLDLYENYFKKLKENKIARTIQTTQSTESSTEKETAIQKNIRLAGQKKGQNKQKSVITELVQIYPDYELGLFLKFDQSKEENILKLLENRNFIKLNELLKKLKITLNYISENQDIKSDVITPTNLNLPNNYESIFSIIKKTTAGNKSLKLEQINKNLDNIINLDLQSFIKSQESLNETNELLDAYNNMKLKKIDFTNLDNKLIEYTTDEKNLEKSIEENKKKIQEFTFAKESIKPDDLNLGNLFDLVDSNFQIKISTFIEYIKYINDKLKENLKDSLLTESNILIEDTINSKMFQIGGTETIQIYKKNLDNMNKITDLNKNTRILLNKLDYYKTLSTDLINNYNKFVKETYDILVYLIYKLNAIKQIKSNPNLIDFKFDEKILNELRNKITIINRKNFGYIKQILINIINDILSKLSISGKKYIDYKSFTNKSSLINIIVLVYLYKYIDKL
jgi:hypothetical protein